MIYPVTDMKTVAHLFDGWEETMIWSCLQGVMGRIYCNDPENPGAAMAMLGDFAFFAGDACESLVLYKPAHCTQDFIIMVPQNDQWAGLIRKCYGNKAKEVSRYAIKKETGIFDRNKLIQMTAALPEGFSLKMIDESAYHACLAEAWSRDLVSQYSDYDTYRRLGLGAVILKDGEPVSGASSYTRYKDGIEIEIDTKVSFRRMGLASICGARLILACMDRNLYPSWDAQNLWSVALAEKLGYHYSHEYRAYEIWGY